MFPVGAVGGAGVEIDVAVVGDDSTRHRALDLASHGEHARGDDILLHRRAFALTRESAHVDRSRRGRIDALAGDVRQLGQGQGAALEALRIPHGRHAHVDLAPGHDARRQSRLDPHEGHVLGRDLLRVDLDVVRVEQVVDQTARHVHRVAGPAQAGDDPDPDHLVLLLPAHLGQAADRREDAVARRSSSSAGSKRGAAHKGRARLDRGLGRRLDRAARSQQESSLVDGVPGSWGGSWNASGGAKQEELRSWEASLEGPQPGDEAGESCRPGRCGWCCRSSVHCRW